MDLQELPYQQPSVILLRKISFLHINKTPALPWHDPLPSMPKYTNDNAFNMLKVLTYCNP